MKLISAFFFVIILFCSCETNKHINLYPQKPYEITENNVTFYTRYGQESWLYIDIDTDYYPYPDLDVDLFFQTNENLQDVKIRSVELIVPELDIQIKKKLSASFRIEDSKKDEYKYFGYGLISSKENINVYDILKFYMSKKEMKISKAKLFADFEKVTFLTVKYIIEYTINEDFYSSEIEFRFNTKNNESNRFWDTLMSV